MSSATGFGPELNAAILLRDGGMCVLRGPRCVGPATSAHHRLNRGSGGSSTRNGAGNGAATCHVCNGEMEAVPEVAELAVARGVKLRNGDDPERVPMWHPFWQQWTQPTDAALELLGGDLDGRF